MIAMVKRVSRKPSAIRTWVLYIFAFIVAGYGVIAFLNRNIGNYMTLQTQFVFFDYEGLLLLFLIDYLVIMVLFVFVGHYLATMIRSFGNKSSKERILGSIQREV